MSSSAEASGNERRPPSRDRLLDAALTIPRGVAQVDFQSSYWTGFIFIIALFVGGWQFGVFGLLGTAVATLTAFLLGVARDRVSIGLEGFCGTLIGVALVLYLGTTWMTAALVVGAAVAGSVLTSAMATVLKPYNLPTFTAPFCVVTLVMVIGAATTAVLTAAITSLFSGGGGHTLTCRWRFPPPSHSSSRSGGPN
ncbi:hypothetical protein GCM10022254_46180 [Actinomadura meridiana]|uniref:DUF4203 domain-containing protein n=1 Tax=Actinomadura meridiana TaxID=559626 RepID=A0ABP8CA89_9ACTN